MPNPLLSKSVLSVLAMIAANLTLATVPILVRLAQAERLPSLTIATLRILMAALLLAPYVLSRYWGDLRRLTRKEIALITIAGFSTAGFFVFFFSALEHTSVLIASVLIGTGPLWVALAEVIFLKALLRRTIWLGLALVLIGSTLFALSGGAANVTLGDNVLLGGGLSLLAALTSGGYLVAGRTVRRRVSTLLYLWLVLIAGLVLMLFILLFTGTPLTGFSTQGYVWVLLMALGAQIIGQASISYALAHMPATLISIAIQLSVILSAGLALLLFAEYPQPLQILASAVIVVGVMVVIVQPKPSVRSAPV